MLKPKTHVYARLHRLNWKWSLKTLLKGICVKEFLYFSCFSLSLDACENQRHVPPAAARLIYNFQKWKLCSFLISASLQHLIQQQQIIITIVLKLSGFFFFYNQKCLFLNCNALSSISPKRSLRTWSWTSSTLHELKGRRKGKKKLAVILFFWVCKSALKSDKRCNNKTRGKCFSQIKQEP